MRRGIGSVVLVLLAASVVILCAELRAANDQMGAEDAPAAVPAEVTVLPEVKRELRSIQCELTAYCPCTKCCGVWAGGNTASGTVPTEGRTVGVDPEVIPLGATVYIDGHAYKAEDTGAFQGNIVDIYMEDHEEAVQFGRKEATVTWEM